MKNPLKWLKNAADALAAQWGRQYAYDTLPPEKVRAASTVPFVREQLVQFSLDEYDRNPYYALVIDNLASHTIGPSPSIIAISQRLPDRDNDLVEDAHKDWISSNQVGFSYREIRKQAALTGIGIGVKYLDQQSTNEVKTSYKVYGANCLLNPQDTQPQDRIYNGIQYNKDWEIEAFHIKNDDDVLIGVIGPTTKEYRVEEVVYWSRGYRKGMVWPLPECYSAFTFYPYIRRFIQAVLEGEEFLSSFPMAVELDPAVYSAYKDSVRNDITAVKGSIEYEPGMIPTLKPGMKLTGIPSSRSAVDREKTMQMFAATCALSVQMPKNLALGDSSNSNMASAQVDIQPWANKVNIDRFDMEPMFRQSFQDWWALAVRRTMNFNIRQKHPLMYPHIYVYPDLFEHPDPNKRASARALDLASGATTLNRLYSNGGLNFRREIDREAKSLGITVEELIQIIVSSRSANALDVLMDTNDELQKQED